jgi:hypothetical protein
MGIYRTLFAVFSTLSLLTLIWTGIREAAPEWKRYQNAYYALLEQKLEAQGTKNFRRPPLTIQQVWLPEIGRVDRCTTCHMGAENKELFADAPQPFAAHPGKYLDWHPVNKFGCTVCHEGQGLATDFLFAAHTPPDLDVRRWKRLVRWIEKGTDDPTSVYTLPMKDDVEQLKSAIEEAEKKLERWEHEYGYDEHKLEFFHEYMLPRKYIEASCMRCHDSRAIEEYAPTLKKARHLITQVHKCRQCHSIPQIPDQPGEPQAPCPDLHGFADKNAHNLDFGSADARDVDGQLLHTGSEIDVLRSVHHDPIEWTVEHFINPQLFIVTSQMAKLDMPYADAESLTAYVRGLFKELPARDYVALRPELPPSVFSEDSPSMFVPPRSILAAAVQAPPPPEPPASAPTQAAPAEASNAEPHAPAEASGAEPVAPAEASGTESAAAEPASAPTAAPPR